MVDDVQAIVDDAADLLNAPVTLEDRAFRLVAHARQRELIDDVRRASIMQRRATEQVRTWFERFGIASSPDPIRTPPDARLGVLARLCLPARWRGVTYGYLWVLDSDLELGDARVATAAELAVHAGSLLAGQQRRRTRDSALLDDLLSGDLELVERVVGSGNVPAGPVTAVALTLAETGQAEAEPAEAGPDFAPALWTLPRRVLATPRDRGVALLVPGDGAAAGSIASRARDMLEAEVSGPSSSAPLVFAGLGGTVSSARSARESWRQAMIAARVAQTRSVQTGTPMNRPILDWAHLGALRLLIGGASAGLLHDEGTRALLGRPPLPETLRRFLDNAGSVAGTAADLGIHRQTLYHRLEQIEKITGRDLRDGADRTTLHLLLQLADFD